MTTQADKAVTLSEFLRSIKGKTLQTKWEEIVENVGITFIINTLQSDTRKFWSVLSAASYYSTDNPRRIAQQLDIQNDRLRRINILYQLVHLWEEKQKQEENGISK